MVYECFRLSSELFQHKTNPRVPDYDYDFAIPLLKLIGEFAKRYGHRLTFHPGQYNILGSPKQKVVDQTIKDLTYHAGSPDLMELDKDSVTYGCSPVVDFTVIKKVQLKDGVKIILVLMKK